MNLVLAVKNYIYKMIEEADKGYKVMLMDKETTSFVSIVLGMSEVMRHEVYMFEKLDQINYSEKMHYLKCIVYVRPTSANIAALCNELHKPRYGSYYIYFSNVISKNEVKTLAEADEHEVVQEVREIYADYLALSPHLFSLGISIYSEGNKWAPEVLQRCIHGISGVLFTLKLIPNIRYRGSSEFCRTLSENIRQMLINEGSLYSESENSNGCLLLVLDRRDDPITPLLHQWTYEAMVHELLGINNGRVTLSHIPGISDDLKEVVMTSSQDEFYAKSMYLNYGEIGQTIKDLMEDYQKKLSKQQIVEISISDMKHFVETYPQFKKMSGNVSKHVTVLAELSKQVGMHKLLEISECQQELVCSHSVHSNLQQKINQLISDPKIREKDAVILAMLYGLTLKGVVTQDLRAAFSLLRKRNLSEKYTKALHNMLEYGKTASKLELFENQLSQDVSNIKRRLFKGIKGVDNVYTQHEPFLVSIVTSLLRGRLKESEFPYCFSPSNDVLRPKVIILFIVGGITHEEAAAVQQLNMTSQGVKILLGGSTVHNTDSFIESVNSHMDGIPKRNFTL